MRQTPNVWPSDTARPSVPGSAGSACAWQTLHICARPCTSATVVHSWRGPRTSVLRRLCVLSTVWLSPVVAAHCVGGGGREDARENIWKSSRSSHKRPPQGMAGAWGTQRCPLIPGCSRIRPKRGGILVPAWGSCPTLQGAGLRDGANPPPPGEPGWLSLDGISATWPCHRCHSVTVPTPGQRRPPLGAGQDPLPRYSRHHGRPQGFSWSWGV